MLYPGESSQQVLLEAVPPVADHFQVLSKIGEGGCRFVVFILYQCHISASSLHPSSNPRLRVVQLFANVLKRDILVQF